jgi:hypothetical protein
VLNAFVVAIVTSKLFRKLGSHVLIMSLTAFVFRRHAARSRNATWALPRSVSYRSLSSGAVSSRAMHFQQAISMKGIQHHGHSQGRCSVLSVRYHYWFDGKDNGENVK